MLSRKRHEARQAEAEEARANVESIKRIPHYELPDPDARAALIALAQSGADCYAYRPVASTEHVVWIRPEWPDMEGRHAPAEAGALARQWQAGQREGGAARAD